MLNRVSEQVTKRALLKVGGMHCGGCVNSIQRRVSSLPGVTTVEVNLANERAVLEYDPSIVQIESIEKAIEEIGYRVVYEKVGAGGGGIV